MCDEPLRLLVVVIHKRRAPRDFRRLSKTRLYSHAVAGLALRAPFDLSSCKLYLDGHGKQKSFLAEMKTSVRWACRVSGRAAQSFEDIRVLDSSHLLIQCADMVAGSAAAAFGSDIVDARRAGGTGLWIKWSRSGMNGLMRQMLETKLSQLAFQASRPLRGDDSLGERNG